MQRFTSFLALFAILPLLAVGCGESSTGTVPDPESGGLAENPTQAPPEMPGSIDDEAYLREGAATVSGTQKVNGQTCGGGVTSPHTVFSAPNTPNYGELLLFTHKATMSDGIPRTVGATYSSATYRVDLNQTADGKNKYEVRFVTKKEEWGMRLWNGVFNHTPNTANNACATWTYSLTNMSPLNGEPNSDNNTGSISDRTQGNSLTVGTQLNRSMYSYSSPAVDVEEWYKVNLIDGRQYKVEVGNYNGRYGTWKYRINVYRYDGTLKTGAELQTTETYKSYEVSASNSNSQHYIQIAGYNKTKNATSNVYYSPYWIKVTDITQTPNQPPTAQVWSTSSLVSGYLPGETFPQARAIAVSDPENDPLVIRFDWNDDGVFDDQDESWQVLPKGVDTIYNGPIHYKNQSSGTVGTAIQIAVEISDGHTTIPWLELAWDIGPNRKPYIHDGGALASPNPFESGGKIHIAANWNTIIDPEDDPISFMIGVHPWWNLTPNTQYTVWPLSISEISAGHDTPDLFEAFSGQTGRCHVWVWMVDPLHQWFDERSQVYYSEVLTTS